MSIKSISTNKPQVASQKKGGHKRIDFYNDYLSTPYIDEPKIIKQIVEQLKGAVITTELHDLNEYTPVMGEPIPRGVDVYMATLNASYRIAHGTFYSYVDIDSEDEQLTDLEILRRIEKFCRDACYIPDDIQGLIKQEPRKRSFARLFELFCNIDVEAFIDIYCSKSTADSLMKTIKAKYTFVRSAKHKRYNIGLIIKSSLLAVREILFKENKTLFLNNDSKTAFDLPVDSATCDYILDKLKDEAFLLTELLMYPLSDEDVFSDYIDRC